MGGCCGTYGKRGQGVDISPTPVLIWCRYDILEAILSLESNIVPNLKNAPGEGVLNKRYGNPSLN